MLRFTLRGLLIGVAICAVGILGLQRAILLLRGNYEPFVRQIRGVKGIHEVRVMDDYDAGAHYVEMLTFRIEGKPDSFVEIWSPDCDIFEDAEHIGLGRLGDSRLAIGVTDSVEDYSAGGCIDIGPESPLKFILPFTIRNLQELIDRYDELEQTFGNWPDIHKSVN